MPKKGWKRNPAGGFSPPEGASGKPGRPKKVDSRYDRLKKLQALVEEDTKSAARNVKRLLKEADSDMQFLISTAPTAERRSFLTEANIHIALAMEQLLKEEEKVENRKEDTKAPPAEDSGVSRDDEQPKPRIENRNSQANGGLPPTRQPSQDLMDDLERSI
jgi:hypothetical protein